MAATVNPLPAEVRCRLRSGVAITSYAQCMEELVLNAIDAGATSVAVRLDLSCGKIQVADNGCGLTRDSLNAIATRYVTSKCHSIEDLDKLQHFGYRGEALASIRSMALMMEIESRHKSSTLTYTRIFKDGKEHSLQEATLRRPSTGTSVTVLELFQSLPVRRKCFNQNLEFELVKQRLEAVTLVNPKISFSLRNDATGGTILQTQKCNSMLGVFTSLYGAGKGRYMKEIQAEEESYKLHGYVGTESHHSKALQFVYINNRLVLKTKIHKLLNFVLSRSQALRRRHFVAGQSGNGSPQKYGDRYGMYLITITCPLSDYDITFDPRKTLVEFKTWKVVLRLVAETTKDLMIQEGLLPSDSQLFCRESSTRVSPDIQEALGDLSSIAPQGSSNESSAENTELLKKTTFSLNDISSENLSNALRSNTVRRMEPCSELVEDELSNSIPGTDMSPDEDDLPGAQLTKAAQVSPSTKGRGAEEGCSRSLKSPLAFMYNSDPSFNSQQIPPTSDTSRDHMINMKTEFDPRKTELDHRKTEFDPRKTEFDHPSYMEPLSLPASRSVSQMLADTVSDSGQSVSQISQHTPAESYCSTLQMLRGDSQPASGQSIASSKSRLSLSPLQRLRDSVAHKSALTTPPRELNSSLRSIIPERILRPNIDASDTRNTVEDESNVTMETSRYTEAEQHVARLQNMKLKLLENDDNHCTETVSDSDQPVSPVRKQTSSLQMLRCEIFKPPPPVNRITSADSWLNLTPLQRLRERATQKSYLTNSPQELKSGSHQSVIPERIFRSKINKPDTKVTVDAEISVTMETKTYTHAEDHEMQFQNIKLKSKETDHNHDVQAVKIIDSLTTPVDPCDEREMADGLNTDKHVEGTSSHADSSHKDRGFFDITDPHCLFELQTAHRTNTVVPHGHNSSQHEATKRCSAEVMSPTLATKMARLRDAAFGAPPFEAQNSGACGDCGVVGGRRSRPRVPNIFISPEQAAMDEGTDTEALKADRGSSSHSVSINTDVLLLSAQLGIQEQCPPKSDISAVKVDEAMVDIGHSAPIRGNVGSTSPQANSGGNVLPVSDTPPVQLLQTGLKVIEGKCQNLSSCKVPSIINPLAFSFRRQMEDMEMQASSREVRHTNETSDIESKSNNDLPLCAAVKYSTDRGQVGAISEGWKTSFQGKYPNETSDEEPKSDSNIPSCNTVSDSKDGGKVGTMSEGWKTSFLPEIEREKDDATRSNPVIQASQGFVTDPVDATQIFGAALLETQGFTHDASSVVTDAREIMHCHDKNLDSHQSGNVITNFEANSVCDEVNKNNLINADGDKGEHVDIEVKSLQTIENQNNSNNPINNDLTNQSETQHIETAIDLMIQNDNKNESETRENEVTTESGTVHDLEPRTVHDLEPRTAHDLEPRTAHDLEPRTVYDLEPRTAHDLEPRTVHDLEPRTVHDLEPRTLHDLEPRTVHDLEPRTAHDLEPRTVHDLEPRTVYDLEPRTAHDLEPRTVHDLEPRTAHDLEPRTVHDLENQSEGSCEEVKDQCEISTTADSTSHSQWVCKVDKTGKKIYINLVTGHSSFNPPSQMTDNTLSILKVKRTHPLRGQQSIAMLPGPEDRKLGKNDVCHLSPNSSTTLREKFSSYQSTKYKQDTSKWRDGSLPVPSTEKDKPISCVQIFEDWDNPVWHCPQQNAVSIEASEGSRGAANIQRTLHPYSFTKDIFNSIQVLGQMDNKFIACLTKCGESTEADLLVVIDQHAAHERVRLEWLIQDSYESCESVVDGRVMRSSGVTPPAAIRLTQEEVRILTSYSRALRNIGIQLVSDADDPAVVMVSKLPACLIESEASESKQARTTAALADLQTMLKEQSNLLQESRGASAVLPKTVLRVLSSRACHGAIKFGDPLDKGECERLIKQLSTCNLPFQCAHGRPSIMPILDLGLYHAKFPHKVKKPKLWKLRKKDEESTEDL